MKILISGLGGDVAQSVAKVLKNEFKDVIIYGLDIATKNAASLYCDHFYLCPRATDKNYINFISTLLQDLEIDFFIPCTEFELKVLTDFIDKPEFKGRIICCSPSILNLCLDKLSTYEFLQSNGLTVPWFTTELENINSFPCIYKKRSSSGSKDIIKINSSLEAKLITQLNPEGLFQEYLSESDQELTCAVFRWGDEHFECLQLLRELKGGATSWAKKVFHDEVYDFCRKVAVLLNLNGSLNIQLRLDVDRPMILEINPRFSSTVHMRHLLGFKDLCWTLSKHMGEEINLHDISISENEIVSVFDAKVLK
jgi:carbamoyl-phosphate synthase large subunit